jgi:hypothetical protein
MICVCTALFVTYRVIVLVLLFHVCVSQESIAAIDEKEAHTMKLDVKKEHKRNIVFGSSSSSPILSSATR